MSDIAPAPERPRDVLTSRLLVIAALVVSLWLTHVGWRNRLLDTHPFRQTQTALSAYWMVHDGLSLDYATPVMGAPWSIPMEFPLYQAAVVAVVKATGATLETAGRTVSLIFFYAMLPGIWLLLRRLRVPETQRWLFLALVLTCPVYIFYSRVFLIESTALCFSVWFLFAFHVALHPGRGGEVVSAAIIGILAGLAKVTTFAVFLLPALLLGLAVLRKRPGEWRAVVVRGVCAVGPGLIAAIAWVAYSDAVKRRNIMGVMMTSAEQRDWNYGPWSLRTSSAFWQQLAEHFRNALAPSATLLLLAAFALLFLRGRWRLATALFAAALAGPLVFANLYFVHDYYLYASGLFFLALLALPIPALFGQSQISWLGRWGAVAAVMIAQLLGYFTAYYPRQSAEATEVPTIFEAIKHVTRPDDVLLGFGINWSSIIPYYTERRALMVPDRYARDDKTISQAIANLGQARVAAVVLFRPGQPPPDFFAPWLKRLGMDETPFLQTGEYTVHLRKDLMPDALKSLAGFPVKDMLIYQGKLGPVGTTPSPVYWVDQVSDHSVFAMMSAQPFKVTVPYGLGTEYVDGRRVFIAHSPSEIEFNLPPNAHLISAVFGMKKEAYAQSDGIEVEIVHVAPNSGPQVLYRRHLLPALIKSDQGPQDIWIEAAQPLEGTLAFRILPGGSTNFDWAFWSKIEIR